MSDFYAMTMIAVIALVTMALRVLPFVVFGGKRETPTFVVYLGKVLPYAIMGMLVVYCLKGITPLQAPHGIPELLAVALVVILHLWKRNTLLSIVGGTVLYMVLIQGVFALG